MKEFAQRKRRPLYVVEAQPVLSAVFELTSSSVHQTFEGWRKALEDSDVDATALAAERHKYALARRRLLQLCSPVKSEPQVIKSAPADLTTEDYIQVMLATIRESRQHINWPPDVIAKFLDADVIR